MAIYTKKLCKQRLQMWLDAEEAIASGQSYQIGTRSLTRANLSSVLEQIEYWGGKLAEIEAEEKSGGRNRMYHFVPRDV